MERFGQEEQFQTFIFPYFGGREGGLTMFDIFSKILFFTMLKSDQTEPYPRHGGNSRGTKSLSFFVHLGINTVQNHRDEELPIALISVDDLFNLKVSVPSTGFEKFNSIQCIKKPWLMY